MWVLTDSGTVKNNDFSLKLMTGAVREAATLDEAAKGIGCNHAVLEETVRQYNHSVHIGRDEAFGKTTMLKVLDEPPFYYGEERLNIHSTEGGVAIDTQARVLNQSEEPSWVFLRPARPSGIFTAKAVLAGTAFWPASSSGESQAKKRLNLASQVIERLQVFCSQRRNGFAFVMPHFHHQGGDSAAD